MMREVILRQGRVMRGFEDFGLGDVPGDTAQSVANAYGSAAQAQAQSYIQTTLQNAGVPPGDIATATQAWSTLGPGAVSTMNALSSGNALGTINGMIPLIGAGLVASGVGAPAAAVIVGGLELLEGVLEKLGLFASSPQITCGWTISAPAFGGSQSFVCFNTPPGASGGSQRPYGPSDPHWLSMEQYQSGSGPSPATWQLIGVPPSWKWNQAGAVVEPNPTPPGTTWAAVTWGWWSTLALDLYSMGISYPGSNIDIQPGSQLAKTFFFDRINQNAFSSGYSSRGPGGSTPAQEAANVAILNNLQGFMKAYEQTLIRACEFPLNDFAPIDLIGLLVAAQLAWNASHDPSVTYTFGDPKNPGSNLIDLICSGSATGQDWVLPPINVGPLDAISSCGPGQILNPAYLVATAQGGSPGNIPVCVSIGTTAGGIGPTTAASKVAVGAAAIGAVAAGGLYVYASFEGIGMLAALKRMMP